MQLRLSLEAIDQKILLEHDSVKERRVIRLVFFGKGALRWSRMLKGCSLGAETLKSLHGGWGGWEPVLRATIAVLSVHSLCK